MRQSTLAGHQPAGLDATTDRPDDCQCHDAAQGVPCWPCWREGHADPNPAAPAADEDLTA
jgi:hypothetical protein